MSALTDSRAVTFSAAAQSITVEGWKAFVQIVEDYEDRIAAGESFTDVTTGNEVIVLGYGGHPYQVYKFQLEDGNNFSTGAYVFTFVGQADTIEDLP